MSPSEHCVGFSQRFIFIGLFCEFFFYLHHHPVIHLPLMQSSGGQPPPDMEKFIGHLNAAQRERMYACYRDALEALDRYRQLQPHYGFVITMQGANEDTPTTIFEVLGEPATPPSHAQAFPSSSRPPKREARPKNVSFEGDDDSDCHEVPVSKTPPARINVIPASPPFTCCPCCGITFVPS